MMLGLSPMMLAGIALAASLAANAGLSWLWLDARDERAVAQEQRDQARHAASECSDATEALRELADKRAVEAKAAISKAKAQADAAARRADRLLSTPATRPGDDCGSARDRVDAWLTRPSAPAP